jgi:alkanesulfonate monooxygenase SsuD/methylene tetrahydromethanopterin reductase-like flavin-dependent oxidoreductase (luciferase family)
MGIGAAWNEEESLAYGIPFPSIKERFVRLEEAIQIIRKMWTDEPSTYALTTLFLIFVLFLYQQ